MPKNRLGRKRKKRKFDQTRVGHLLKYEAPDEYALILSVYSLQAAPSADLIEAIGYSSSNALFKKPKFRRALIEYRRFGLYCGEPREDGEHIERYYKRIHKNTLIKELKCDSMYKNTRKLEI